MSQEIFSWVWLVLLLVVNAVRKAHVRKSQSRGSLRGVPFLEAALMVLWGIAATLLPLLYLFATWLDFADVPSKVSSLLGFTGTAIFLTAIWLLHRSHSDLKGQWSPMVEPIADNRLVTEGAYKRIRHPMYTAHILWGIAQTLLLQNYIVGPLALLLMLIITGLRIPREERAMLARYGDEYRQYMNKTGRIVPRLDK